MPPRDLPPPSSEDIEQFRHLYQRRCGVLLTPDEALEQLMYLLTIVQYQQTQSRAP